MDKPGASLAAAFLANQSVKAPLENTTYAATSPSAGVPSPASTPSSGAPVAASTAVAIAATPSPNNNRKRPAESPAAPSMNKAAAAAALSSLRAVPTPRNQSLYVRFKALLLEEAKQSGDADAARNITKVAKEAWATVKKLTPLPPVDPATETSAAAASATADLSAEARYHLGLKGRAMREERDDKDRFHAQGKTYCDAFVPAATAYLQWHTMEATADSFASLEEATAMVASRAQLLHLFSGDIAAFQSSLEDAKGQLAKFRETTSARGLFEMLRNATDEELTAHVAKYRGLLELKKEADGLKAKERAVEEGQRRAEERELARADTHRRDVTRALSKQMRYTDLPNKYSSVRISYAKGGVTPRVFAKAFDVAAGTKRATIPGRDVGTKCLRYGAYLACSDVHVRLVGEELIAETRYSMCK